MLYFHHFVLEVTTVCNFRCRHCFQSSGPSANLYGLPKDEKFLSLEKAEKYIRQVPKLKNVGRRLFLSGGEITLFEKELRGLIRLGKKYNLPVSLVTNGSFAKNQKKADQLVKELKRSGLFQLQVSVSCFHQEFIDMGYIVRVIRACKKHKIEPVLRPTVVKTCMADRTVQDIPSKDLAGTMISTQSVKGIGRAQKAISRSDFFYREISWSGCGGGLNLNIRQDGAVYPCCAGSELTEFLCLGNANKESLEEILRRAEFEPVLSILFSQGPRYLSKILKEATGRDLAGKRYDCICSFCLALFNDPKIAHEVAYAVKKYLKTKTHDGQRK